jgi:hypothetical protein
MSWEALRLTSRTPAEVYRVLGPHGVEELIRDARNACWRELPEETRTIEQARRKLAEVFHRNIAVWTSIKKPSPEAFFQNLLPHAADGLIRQALVLCWMMMPRGKRSLGAVRDVVSAIYDRTLEAWEEDHIIFTKGPGTRKKASGKAKSSPRPGKKAKRRKK